MPIADSYRMLLIPPLLLLLTACVSHEPRQLVPSISLSPDNSLDPVNDGEARTAGVDFGFTVAPEDNDALDNVAPLPGVRVRSVSPGGPADQAGILAGDVILSVDGRDINHRDTLDAVALDIEGEQHLMTEVRRDTRVFNTILNVSPTDTPRSSPVELYRADPIFLRAGFTTELLEDADGEPLSGARLVRLFPESPLPGTGLAIDDIILSVEGRTVESAQGLVTLIHGNYEPGDRVSIHYARDNQVNREVLQLWHPGRRLSRFSLWPLFVYESSLSPDQTSLTIGDLWLFSLFSYQRREGEREYSVLGLFRTTTGYGELLEE